MASALARSRKARRGTEALCEWVFRPLAHLVVLVLAPLRVPPPAVVLASTASGIAGAVALAGGHFVAAALLVQLKTVLDNADGQLARLTGRVSVFGRYLDCECDLLVDAALLAALGRLTGHWVLAAVGFAAMTAVLSVNFNVERLSRGAATSRDPSLLGRLYTVLYGWQDVLVERIVERRIGRPGPLLVGVLANMGMSTQLAVFGLCIALGHPLVYVFVVFGELALVATFFTRVTIDREVVLEHR